MSNDEIKATAGVFIEDGAHNGTIVKVENRTSKEYTYTDIHVSVDDVKSEKPIVIKMGVPANVSPATGLGRLLALFTGKEIVPGQTYSPKKILEGKKVKFMTINEKTERGNFARIVDGSLKPSA